LLLLAISHGLKFLGKHLLLMKVVVDPESNNTLKRALGLTEEMVSTTMIVTNMRFVSNNFLNLFHFVVIAIVFGYGIEFFLVCFADV
jgi:hypothetical protein